MRAPGFLIIGIAVCCALALPVRASSPSGALYVKLSAASPAPKVSPMDTLLFLCGTAPPSDYLICGKNGSDRDNYYLLKCKHHCGNHASQVYRLCPTEYPDCEDAPGSHAAYKKATIHLTRSKPLFITIFASRSGSVLWPTGKYAKYATKVRLECGAGTYVICGNDAGYDDSDAYDVHDPPSGKNEEFGGPNQLSPCRASCPP